MVFDEIDAINPIQLASNPALQQFSARREKALSALSAARTQNTDQPIPDRTGAPETSALQPSPPRPTRPCSLQPSSTSLSFHKPDTLVGCPEEGEKRLLVALTPRSLRSPAISEELCAACGGSSCAKSRRQGRDGALVALLIAPVRGACQDSGIRRVE